MCVCVCVCVLISVTQDSFNRFIERIKPQSVTPPSAAQGKYPKNTFDFILIFHVSINFLKFLIYFYFILIYTYCIILPHVIIIIILFIIILFYYYFSFYDSIKF